MESTQVPNYQLLTIKRLRQVLDVLGRERKERLLWMGVLVRMTGNHTLAVVLDQALAWQRVKDKAAPDAWWYKTDGEWEAELGAGRKAMTKARVTLPACGVLAEKRRAPGGNERVWHYRVEWPVFARRLAAILSTTVEKIFATIEKLIAMERVAAERQVAKLLATYGVRSVPNGQYEVPQTDSSNSPDGTVQSVQNGQVELSQTDTTLIHPISTSESASGSASGSPPPSGARAREEAAAEVGVSAFPFSSLKNIFQVTSAAPGWTRGAPSPGSAPPPSPPPQWALDIARHAARRGRLRSGDLEAYALGVVANRAGPAPVKTAVLALPLDEFVVER